jgi:hypothetical protein
LREVGTPEGLGVGKRHAANLLVIDDPLDVFLGPVDSIRVPSGDGGAHWVVDGAVVGGNIAFAEEVALDGGIGRSKPLPINLIEVIRFEDETADDTGSRGSLGVNADIAEHDVFGGGHGRGTSLGLDLEVGS